MNHEKAFYLEYEQIRKKAKLVRIYKELFTPQKTTYTVEVWEFTTGKKILSEDGEESEEVFERARETLKHYRERKKF